MSKGLTKKDAAYRWVQEFNAFPHGMIKQLMQDHPKDWAEITVFDEEQEVLDYLPMWGTLWSFGNGLDNYWLTEMDGIKIMSECGFRIYEHAEWGYFFGIDGAGYDFYEAHWIPLYEKRGFNWHDEEDNV